MIQNYILIIGAMKSGTTTLFDLLASHPAIAPCYPKEPGFFAFEDRWAEGFKWYESLFDFDPDRHLYALDGSTDYSKHPFCNGVADRLAQSAPRRFKLIYIMRHPLRRIESHARHVQRTRKEIGQLPSVRPNHSLDAGISPVSLAISRYASQLDQYLHYHDTGDLLLLSFEDLVTDQSAVLETVFAFLSLEPMETAPKHSNPAKKRRKAPAHWQTLSRLGPFSNLAKAILPRQARNAVHNALSRETETSGRFAMTLEEENKISKALAPDLARLSAVFGIDAKCLWGIDPD